MTNEWIKKYFANELSARDRNAFEQEVENDRFLQESMEGLELWTMLCPQNKLSELEQELHKRADEHIHRTKK